MFNFYVYSKIGGDASSLNFTQRQSSTLLTKMQLRNDVKTDLNNFQAIIVNKMEVQK